jgi:hypothetical protein
MNQQIRQLAEQAGYKHPDAVGMCEDYAYFDHEKFAELIVAECAQLAEYAGYNQQFGQGGLRAKLHKHFGIEP